jgi:hypothetical protein
MQNTTFQPIFDYIDESLKKQKEEILEEIPSKTDFQKLQTSVNNFASRFNKIETGSKVEAAKAERIEHWVIQAAEKVEVPYKP